MKRTPQEWARLMSEYIDLGNIWHSDIARACEAIQDEARREALTEAAGVLLVEANHYHRSVYGEYASTFASQLLRLRDGETQ